MRYLVHSLLRGLRGSLWLLLLAVSAQQSSQADSVGSPTVCSVYKGLATLNEFRIGSSGRSSTSNQIEIFNDGGIDASVWQTWQLVVHSKDSRGRITRRGGYYLSSGFTANGQFIYNNSKKIYLRNRNPRVMDITLVDRFGYLIDYLALEGKIQTQPDCFGAGKVVDLSATKNTSGNISRMPDGAVWPGFASNTASHTIGRSNVCTLTGNDLSVSNSVDISSPIINNTTLTFSINVLNKSCSGSIGSIVLTDSGLSTSNFSSLSASASVGSTSTSASALTWNIGTLAAGASATLTVTGKAKVLGTTTTTAAITAPVAGLVNTGDDSDSETITARDYNYVGFDQLSASITEGTDTSYTVTITSDVEASKPITVKYSVSGTAGAGDTDLPASGSVTIDPSDDEAPTEASINFNITNDATYEPDKSIILRITGVTSTDANVKLDTDAQEMRITLVDDDPAFIAPGGFNAFETSTAAGAVAGVIMTKVAGQSFNLDIVALNSDSSGVSTAFAGDVAVELVNADSSAGCVGLSSVGSATTLTFTAADNGRKSIAMSHADAWQNLRVRMKYPATGSPTLTACSTDNFAIKPASLAVAASDADWQTAGTARTLNVAGAGVTPIHKAGRPFTLRVTGYNAANNVTASYSGSPTAQITCLLPAVCNLGVLSTGAFTASGGTLTSTTASYIEVGAINATFADSAWGSVDSADSPASCAGYYVCSSATAIGRFVPDHFDISANTPAFTPACGTFSYMGQPFDFGVAPNAGVAPEWTVTARNASGGTTANYTGSLFKLAADTITGQTWSAASGTVTPVGSLPAVSVSDLGGGRSRLLFSVGAAASGGGLKFERTASVAPFDASLNLSASVADSEGVVHTGNPYLHSGIGFAGGQAGMRFGRLRLGNATGSERVALPLPLTAQYWNGQGFVANTADNCTPIAAPSLTFFTQSADNQLASGETTASFNPTLAGGNGNLRLSAPGIGNFGFLDLSVGAPAWLQYNWDGVDQGNDANLLDDNPRARAAFGKRGGSDKVFMRRETF